MFTQLRQSIATLQHQINLERKSHKDRRIRIHDERERQKQLIEYTEGLISVGCKYRETVKSANVKGLRELPKKIASLSTPDLIQLRAKLVHVRSHLASEKL